MVFYRAKGRTLPMVASGKEQGRHHTRAASRSCLWEGSNVAVRCGLHGKVSCQARGVWFSEVGAGEQMATDERELGVVGVLEMVARGKDRLGE